MKKKISRSLLFCSFLCLFSFQTLYPSTVDLGKARSVAIHFLEKKHTPHPSPSLEKIAFLSSYSFHQGGTTIYHVFNLTPQGFILIAADDAVHPVLAYSFTGTWNQDDLPQGVKQWMNSYKEEILAVKNNHLLASCEISNEWSKLMQEETAPDGPELLPTSVSPLLTTTWDQTFPYNAYCPVDSNAGAAYSYHVPAGCGAVAMAQLMYYWRYPLQGNGQHCIDTVWQNYGTLCADFGNTTYAWNGMVNHPDQECAAAALLCYQAGVSINMNYGPTISLSGFSDIPVALMTNFRFSENMNLQQRGGFMYNNWISLLKSSLDQGKPVLYSGFNGGDGHIFICDGYDANNLFHFNWGWGGDYDGYFNVNNLNPGTATYNQSQSAIFTIQPDPLQYPPYCAGQTAPTTFDFGSIEDGSGPVNSYQTGADCRWLIQPTDSVSSITLHFVRFNVAPADGVEVYKGSSTTDPLIGSFTGSSLPSDLTVSSSQLLVRLISGTSATAAGFLAEYSTTAVDFCRSDTLLFSNEGELFDGSDQSLYRNNAHCLWYILPFGAQSLTLLFTEFDTEKDCDFVNVYDLVNPNPIARLSGHSNPLPPPIISATGMMLVEFVTNEMNRDTGWRANYTIEVGIANPEVNNRLTVWPNPAQDHVTVKLNQFRVGEACSYELVDAYGRVCLLGRSEQPSFDFSCQGLAPGIYYFRITCGKGRCEGKKLVLVP